MSCITFPAGREDKQKGGSPKRAGADQEGWLLGEVAAQETCWTCDSTMAPRMGLFHSPATRKVLLSSITGKENKRWFNITTRAEGDDRTLSSALPEHIFNAFQVLQMQEWILSPPQHVISIPKDGRNSPFRYFLFKNVYREFSLETEFEAPPFLMMNDLLETKHAKGFK